MTVLEALLSLSAYPVPQRTIESITLKRGVGLDWTADTETLSTREYRLCEADVYMWLYEAPNVGQGGQSYSFTAEQRDMWRRRAKAIYDELGEDMGLSGKYGWMGTRL